MDLHHTMTKMMPSTLINQSINQSM